MKCGTNLTEYNNFWWRIRQRAQAQDLFTRNESRSGWDLRLLKETHAMQTNNISSTTPIKASEDLVVDVLECETPIISKNQQLREQGKRSSIGLRGKRVSEVLNGTQASPHSDIATNKYYTLIDAGLSDPLRMRQLILWCAMKAIQSNSLVAGNKSIYTVWSSLTTPKCSSWRFDDQTFKPFLVPAHCTSILMKGWL